MAGGERTVLHGGLPFYGSDIGIIMLNNDCPRPVGDIGNAATWPFPVLYDVVEAAVPSRVVESDAEGLLPSFVAAARRLDRAGVRGITTSCGFLAIFQRELAAAVTVPVATSSLLQVPAALRSIGDGRRVCVLTINAQTLGRHHFRGVGVSDQELERVVVVGMEDSAHLYGALVGGSRVLDLEVAERELVGAARRAVAADDSIGGFVFECTNMPPYSAAVRAAVNRPVWDTVTLVRSLRAAVVGWTGPATTDHVG